VNRRLVALLATEARVERRYQIPAAVGGLAVAWSALAALAPASTPYLLFIEVATVGTFLVGALAVMERQSGVLQALAVSPMRAGEYVASRLAPLTALTVAAAVPPLVAGGARRYPSVLAAVALTTVLLLATGLAVALRRHTLIGFLTALPWPLIPFFAVPLAVAVGLLTHPAWYVVPTTGALAVIRGGFGAAPPYAGALLGYLAAWTVLACAVAVRVAGRPDGAPRPATPAQVRRSREWRGPRWMSFVRADVRNVSRDSVLVPIALSPLLLGAALRFGYPPLASWALRTHELDLDPYRPVLALLAVVLHVPVIAGMMGALIVLDDVDDGALQVVRVSPLGVRRYLAYRVGAVTGFAVLGLAVAAPLSGMVPARAWGAVALAAVVAPLFMLGVLAVARNRVQGLTLTKLLGLPVYAPVATWWLAGAAGLVVAPLPTYWVIRAWDGSITALAIGLVCAAAWLLLLGRRVVGWL
jgi:fluoroquinolone transport system permease protein